MPNTHSTLASLFTDIADSIRAKTGSNGLITADNFPTAIDNLPVAEEYDGTVIAIETWIINNNPTVPSTEPFMNKTFINFISNGNEYGAISYGKDAIFNQIIFYDSMARVIYDTARGGWTDQNYRTVSFLESPTGSLLTWLQENAVKQ